jgi:hypothetical protein
MLDEREVYFVSHQKSIKFVTELRLQADARQWLVNRGNLFRAWAWSVSKCQVAAEMRRQASEVRSSPAKTTWADPHG